MKVYLKKIYDSIYADIRARTTLEKFGDIPVTSGIKKMMDAFKVIELLY